MVGPPVPEILVQDELVLVPLISSHEAASLSAAARKKAPLESAMHAYVAATRALEAAEERLQAAYNSATDADGLRQSHHDHVWNEGAVHILVKGILGSTACGKGKEDTAAQFGLKRVAHTKAVAEEDARVAAEKATAEEVARVEAELAAAEASGLAAEVKVRFAVEKAV